jgi:hypothetical protein
MRSLRGLLCVLLAGCTSTGILPAGPETYTITKNVIYALGGTNEAEREAMTEANKSCQDKGLTFIPTAMGPSGPAGNMILGYTVTFRCLQPNDPAVAKYQLGQSPNVIIEQRNR